MQDKHAKIAFVVSACFVLMVIVFGYGLAVGQYKLWPFGLVQEAKAIVVSYAKYAQFVPHNRRHRAAPDAPRVSFAIHAPELRAAGQYVFFGWDENEASYAAWLYDADGEHLHTWLVDYAALDPEGRPSGSGGAPHAFHVLADGSILVGFDRGEVMARLDRCSQPVWIRDGIFHHSMEPAEDGGIWTWRAEGSAYGHYHYLENFDPETGQPRKEIALVDDIIRNTDPGSNLFGVRPDHTFQHMTTSDPENQLNWFHPNDIEELSSSRATNFPLFEAGDLMLSFRNMHMVMVVDPDDHRVKWWSRGPWLFQHDPDFREDGRISVYSNNSERERSEILTIEPETRTVANELYAGGFAFYSAAMGKHQYLPNGNVLIVVPQEGRIVELTADGRKVLEFNNLSPAGEAYNEMVANAMWLPPGYFERMPSCPELALEQGEERPPDRPRG